MKLRILSIFAALLAGIAHAQVPLDKMQATFTTSPGLETKLWGGEPGFVNPTCMDIDHLGRVWIVESVNYRTILRKQPLRDPKGDRILILEGAGKMDKVSVFYQAPEIHSPLGIAVLPYADGKGVKVYVAQTPNIWVFVDKDGDNNADGPPTVLLTGFKGLDHDHGVHGLLIGPDNKLYFTVGDQGVSKLKSSDGKGPEYNTNTTDCRAATVWRCDLDGKNLQLLAHNFRNNYEPAVDSFGTVFLSDNDDDGQQQTRICYVMKGGDYGYHRTPKTSHWNEEHPGIVHKILRTYFGSPTGICVYEGQLLLSRYRGSLLHTDAGPRHLRSYMLKAKGAAYSVEQENLIQSTDTWFRPSDVCVAPDGSVFVADWYDPGVGGHNMGDIKMGRIYRLAPPGIGSSVPKIELDSDSGIITALASGNLAVRALAMAKIQEMGFEKAYAGVLHPALKQDKDRLLRARALWQLARFGNFKHVHQALSDADPDFRVLALRITSDFFQQSPIDLPEEYQKNIVDDPSAAVRREALLLLQKVDPVKAGPMIHALAAKYDGIDRFYLSAIGIAVGHHDPQRREILLADFEKHHPGWNQAIAGMLWELRPPNVGKLLEKRLGDASLPSAQRSQIVDILALSLDAKGALLLVKALAIEKDATVRGQIVFELRQNLGGRWKDLRGAPELIGTVSSLMNRNEDKADGLALIAAAELKAFAPKVIAIVQDEKAPAQLRVAAVQALAAFKTPETQGVLGAILANYKSQPETLVLEALQTLGKLGTDGSTNILRTIVLNNEPSRLFRQTAVAGLASSKTGSEMLLKDYEAKLIAGDLTADLSRLLRNSQFPATKTKATAVLPAPPKFDPKNLPSIPALLTRKGNVEKGRLVMQASLKNNAACLKCHAVLGEGGKVGPDLSVIGSKVSKENLLESILYPSRAIADQYMTYLIETKDGRTIVSVIAEETPTKIVVLDVNANQFVIETKNLEGKTKTGKSIMPEDLTTYLSEDELIDLVEYMYSLKQSALTPVGSTKK